MDDPSSSPREPRPRVQFGGRTLMALVSAFVLLLASGACFGAVGYVVYFLVAALLAIMATPRLRRPNRFVFYGFLLLLVIALLWFILRAALDLPGHPAKSPARRGRPPRRPIPTAP